MNAPRLLNHKSMSKQCSRGIRQTYETGCACHQCSIFKNLGVYNDNANIVDLYSGTCYFHALDLEIPCKGFNWKFERTYKGGSNFKGPLGHNWDFNYNRRLEVMANGNILLHDGYCKIYEFVLDRKNFRSATGLYTVLNANKNGTFLERDKNGNIAHYTSPDKKGIARIVDLSDRNGNAMKFIYNGDGQLLKVYDTYGRIYEYLYNKFGFIKSVNDFSGRKLLFEYSSDEDLILISLFPNKDSSKSETIKNVGYGYTNGHSSEPLNHNLTEIIAPNEYLRKGEPFLHIKYDTDSTSSAFGRIVKLEVGGINHNKIMAGGVTKFEYNARMSVTSVTDRNGNRSEFQFDSLGNIIRKRDWMNRRIISSNPIFFESSFKYNSDGELILFRLPEGNSVEYIFDDNNKDTLQRGNLILQIWKPDKTRETGQDRIQTRYTYEPIYNQLRSIDEFYLDRKGKSSKEVRIIEHIFDYQEGNSVKALAKRLSISEDSVKKLLANANMKINLGDINKDQKTNQIGGNIVKAIYPRLIINTKFQSDKTGQGKSEVSEFFNYNDAGQITNKIDQEGNSTIFQYYPTIDPDGGRSNGAQEDVIKQTGYLKLIRRNEDSDPVPGPCIDAAPRRISRLFIYDIVGNLTGVTDARGVTEYYERDYLNRVISLSRAADLSNSTHGKSKKITGANKLKAYNYRKWFSYDSNDNLIEKIIENRDSNNEKDIGQKIITELKYDILDRPVEIAHFDDNPQHDKAISRYRYDRNENLVLEISPVASLASEHKQYQGKNIKAYIFDETDQLAEETHGGVSLTFVDLAAHKDIENAKGYCIYHNGPAIRYRYDGNRNLVEFVDGVGEAGYKGLRITSYVYDGFDRIISKIDPAGNGYMIKYDSTSNITSYSIYGHTPSNEDSEPRLDTLNFPRWEKYKKQLLTQVDFKYDELHRLVQEIHKGFLYREGQNDGESVQVGKSVDNSKRNDLDIRYVYDRKGRLVAMLHNDQLVSRRLYNSMDWVCAEVDAEGNQMQFSYDANGNLVRFTEIEITQRDSVATGKVPDLRESYTMINVYDSLNRLERTTDNLGNTYYFEYDSRNNLIGINDAQYSMQTTDLIRDPLGLFPVSGQDSRGITSINRPGNRVDFYYDGFNRLVSEVAHLKNGGQGKSATDTSNVANPDGLIVIDYEWDVNGRLIAMADDGSGVTQNTTPGTIENTNDKGNVTRYQYDEKNRIIKEIYADGSVKGYTYGAPFSQDEIETIIDPNGSTILFVYDSLGQLAYRRFIAAKSSDPHPLNGFKDQSVSWEVIGTKEQVFGFDWLGRITMITDTDDLSLAGYQNANTLRFYYDSLGRIVEEVQNGVVIKNTFDALGNRVELKYPNGRLLNFAYDKLNRLREIRDPGSSVPLARYEYIGPDRVLERSYSNGTRLSYLNDSRTQDIGYDGIKRIILQRHIAQDNTLIAGFAEGYDRVDNKLSEQYQHANNELHEYRYDSAHRLVNTSTQTDSTSWQLDGIGNWTSYEGISNQVNNTNEYLNFNGVRHFYDMNGNMIDDGIYRYQYDVLNRLCKVLRKQDNQMIASYRYDGLDRRTEKTASRGAARETVQYFYDGWQEIEERRDDSIVQYVFGPYIDELVAMEFLSLNLRPRSRPVPIGGNTIFFHEDARRNITAISDTQGRVLERYSYQPYGYPSISSSSFPFTGRYINTRLFSGRYLDEETGFYYFRNRYLDPREGRFITRDPYGIWGDRFNLGNPYTYTGNNPLKLLDPYGLAACECPTCRDCPSIQCITPDCSEYGYEWCQSHPCYCGLCGEEDEDGGGGTPFPTGAPGGPPLSGGGTPPTGPPTGGTPPQGSRGSEPPPPSRPRRNGDCVPKLQRKLDVCMRNAKIEYEGKSVLYSAAKGAFIGPGPVLGAGGKVTELMGKSKKLNMNGSKARYLRYSGYARWLGRALIVVGVVTTIAGAAYGAASPRIEYEESRKKCVKDYEDSVYVECGIR